MTYYVPDWDDTSHSLKVFDNASVYDTNKRGAHPHQHQYHHSLQKKSSAALVPNHDVSESLTEIGMQGEVSSHITGEVERASVPALDMPLAMSNPCIHEDEMLSWLRYPCEDSFDRNYCSEMFGELVNSHVHLVKDAFIHQTMRETENTHEITIEGTGREQAGLQQLVNTASMHCARPGVKSDAAMAMGAGRAAGLVSQTGSEAFTGVRTHVHPSSLLKPMLSSVTVPSLDGKETFETYDPIISLLDVKKTSDLSPMTPSMSSGFNFSMFSRPVATTLDSLRIVGAASGPINVERARQPLAKDLSPPPEPSIGDSNGCAVMSMQPSSQQSTEFSGLSSQVKVAIDGGGYTLAGWSLPTNLQHRPDVLPRRLDVRMLNETVELNSHDTCFSGSAITVSENALGMTETAETTMSPSRLSGSSTEETAEEAFTSTPKKKSSPVYTEEVEDVTANARKPPPGPRAMKRGRAAETHNESEKKRRNKINVRLKALQSLIPNSNKTDKASVLDEAIEYTKMLQAQVQFMSMRTGMFVPQMMIPSGMHYVPVHQMPLSHMGMGMGMGFGMGSDMRVADINAATAGLGVVASVTGAGAGAGAGAVLNSSPTSNQSPSRQVHAGARLQQSSPAPLIHNVSLCLPTSCTNEPYNVMLAQQPLQPMPMNMQMNPDMYNALVQQRQPPENHISDAIH